MNGEAKGCKTPLGRACCPENTPARPQMGDPEQSVPHEEVPPREAERSAPVGSPVTSGPSPADPFWARLRRHKVVEWTLAYVAFGYALLHGVQMLRETFDWPSLVPRFTVFSIVLGAPAVRKVL